MVLAEDTKSPCNGGEGILVMSWLRVLAYNLVSVFRSHLPRKDRRAESWKRACEMIYQAFFLFESLVKGEPNALMA